jgi:hypothetical protein
VVAEYAPTVACTLILACAKTTPAALTPEGARVRVSDAGGVEGCEYIGDFVASQPSGKALPGWLATGQVRNRAARAAPRTSSGTTTSEIRDRSDGSKVRAHLDRFRWACATLLGMGDVVG